MDRRAFARNLVGWSVVVAGIPMVVTVAGCSNNSGTSGPSEETWTSSMVGNHVHDFSLLVSVLDAPPASGVSGGTSTSEGHLHSVTLTQEQLKSIGSGGTVTVTTTLSSGHMHDFVFSRGTGTVGGGGNGGGGGGGGGY